MAYALQQTEGPVALILSRQNLPVLSETAANVDQLSKGGYILSDSHGEPDVILIATGSEVSLALESKAGLEKENVKTSVVALPSWELFAKQSQAYKESVLPSSVKRRERL